MKKLLVVCLAMVMVLSLATTALAAGNGKGNGGGGITRRDRLQDGSCAVCPNASCPLYPDCPRDGSCQLLSVRKGSGGGIQHHDRLRDGSCLL